MWLPQFIFLPRLPGKRLMSRPEDTSIAAPEIPPEKLWKKDWQRLKRLLSLWLSAPEWPLKPLWPSLFFNQGITSWPLMTFTEEPADSLIKFSVQILRP